MHAKHCSYAAATTKTGKYCVSPVDRKSTRLNSSHSQISYAVFCLKKKNNRKRVATAAGIRLALQAPCPGRGSSVLPTARQRCVCRVCVFACVYQSICLHQSHTTAL